MAASGLGTSEAHSCEIDPCQVMNVGFLAMLDSYPNRGSKMTPWQVCSRRQNLIIFTHSAQA